MKKGEVWLAVLPEGEGREQRGERPVLVLGSANEVVIAIPFTRNPNVVTKPFTASFDPTKENGLTDCSTLLVFQLMALSETRFIKKLGWIPKEQRAEIDDLVKELLKLGD